MLGIWRVIWAPGVATSISLRSSARAVAPADQPDARPRPATCAPGCARCSAARFLTFQVPRAERRFRHARNPHRDHARRSHQAGRPDRCRDHRRGHRHAAERRGDRQDPPGPPGSQGGVPARPEPELPQAGRVRRAARPADPGPPDAGFATWPAAAGGDRLTQGRQGQLLAHRCHLRRPAACLHAAARRGDPADGRRHAVGQHGLRVSEPAAA